jgi:AmiR/NasT family two-component response regulator
MGTMDLVYVPDFLVEARWPRYLVEALASGIRCSQSVALPIEAGLLTVTVYGLRPDVFDPAITRPAVMLCELGVRALANATKYEEERRAVAQMREALASRAVIEQAKGVIMHALGCDEDAAFAELRRVSHVSNRKVADIAGEVVRSATTRTPSVHEE